MRYVVPSLIVAAILSLLHLLTTAPNDVTEPIVEPMQEILFGGVLSAEVAVDTTVETTNTATEISSPGIVWVSDTNGYIFYEDSGGGLSMSSTTNSGATWSAARNVDSVNTTDVVSYGVWWEGWTPGTTTTRYIHIVTTDLGVDDTYYTRLDTQTGAFTATVLGTTQAATCTEGLSCYTSITMTATGTLYMSSSDAATSPDDTWVVSCFQYLGCSTASNWNERTGGPLGNNIGTDATVILLPIPGNDNLLFLFHRYNADQINFNIYSATSSSWWSSSGIAPPLLATAIEDNTTYDSQLMGATLSTTTGLIYLAISDDTNDYTTADHDVRVWQYSTSTWTWTEKTICVQNHPGGITAAKIAWDETNDTLYCIFGARSTIGTPTTGGIYYKTSTDGGTTWSATSSMVNDNADDINGMSVNIIGNQRIGVTWNYTTAPRADQQFYDDIADLIADAPAPAITPVPQIIWLD